MILKQNVCSCSRLGYETEGVVAGPVRKGKKGKGRNEGRKDGGRKGGGKDGGRGK